MGKEKEGCREIRMQERRERKRERETKGGRRVCNGGARTREENQHRGTAGWYWGGKASRSERERTLRATKKEGTGEGARGDNERGSYL